MRSSRLPWVAIGIGAVVLGTVFHQEVLSAVAVWSSSTAYGHCWLVLPIVAWLLWERRDFVRALAPRPVLWPALLAVPLVAAWLLADTLGIMEGRQLAALGLVELLLMAALGWRLWWALSAAFLYLVFLVPFGAFLTPALQQFTTSFIVHGLRLLNIPFETDAFRITIPEGAFYVAEACAGLRFLIASIAFGVLYAVTMFRSPGRRLVFIAVSCVLPVVANGIRGLGIVLLGHALGSAEAGAADHLIYGWVFFSTVIVLLAICGLSFREAPAPLRAAPAAGPPARLWGLAGSAAVVLAALAAPAASVLVFTGGTTALQPIVPPIQDPAGCLSLGVRTAPASTTASFTCGNQRLAVTAMVLARGTNPARVLERARATAVSGLLGEVDTQVERLGGGPWGLMMGRDVGGAAAFAVCVEGVQSVGGMRDRLRMARAAFVPGPPPVILVVAVEPGQPGGVEALRTFLSAQKFCH